MLDYTKGRLSQLVGEFLCRNGPWSSLFVIQSLVPPSMCEVSRWKRFQNPPESAEFLQFVIKCRSANHSCVKGTFNYLKDPAIQQPFWVSVMNAHPNVRYTSNFFCKFWEWALMKFKVACRSGKLRGMLHSVESKKGLLRVQWMGMLKSINMGGGAEVIFVRTLRRSLRLLGLLLLLFRHSAKS